MRDGVISRSNCSWMLGANDLVGGALLDFERCDSERYDLRYQRLFSRCQAGGAHGPSDSGSDSSGSGGALHRDECMFECALYAEWRLRSGSKSPMDVLSDMSEYMDARSMVSVMRRGGWRRAQEGGQVAGRCSRRGGERWIPSAYRLERAREYLGEARRPRAAGGTCNYLVMQYDEYKSLIVG